MSDVSRATMTGGRAVEVRADLRFSVELPGRAPVCGTFTGSGTRLELRLSDPASFAGRADAKRLRGVADGLAARGITVLVVAGDDVLLEVGAIEAPWWQRPVTGSRHLRVASLRGAITGATGRVRRSRAGAVLPGSDLLPPVTLLPLAPTFGPAPRPVTTTHDARRGGHPRLVLTSATGTPADRRTTFALGETTTIGSDPECDICLPALEPLHAVVVHDERDELVLHDRSSDRSTRVNGAVVHDGRVLRTGTRVSVGAWTLAYRRAEFADHGRPYGGRIGGEAGRQRSQSDPRTRGRA